MSEIPFGFCEKTSFSTLPGHHLELAVHNPPAAGERVRIINQLTEIHRIRDLAGLVADLTGAEIRLMENPRREASSNDLDASNATLLRLGLRPITLNDGLLREISDIARVYAERCDWSKVPATARWIQPRASSTAGGVLCESFMSI